jgi:hypothetical protein
MAAALKSRGRFGFNRTQMPAFVAPPDRNGPRVAQFCPVTFPPVGQSLPKAALTPVLADGALATENSLSGCYRVVGGERRNCGPT